MGESVQIWPIVCRVENPFLGVLFNCSGKNSPLKSLLVGYFGVHWDNFIDFVGNMIGGEKGNFHNITFGIFVVFTPQCVSGE